MAAQPASFLCWEGLQIQFFAKIWTSSLRPVSTSGHGLMLRRRPIPGAYVAVLAALAVAARCGALPDSADWKDIQAQPCNLGLQDKYGRVRREKARVRESSAVS